MNPKPVLDFLRICGKLKHLKRTGWVHNDVHEPETVASHMYRMSIIAMIVPNPDGKLDISKCMKMSLVHDIGEAIIGDITPFQGVSDEDKFDLERKALDKIVNTLGESEAHTTVAKEILDLWLEYEANLTPEAKIVKEIDKFDMILQAQEYEQSQDKKLESFFKYCQGYFKDPFIQSLSDQIYKERNQK